MKRIATLPLLAMVGIGFAGLLTPATAFAADSEVAPAVLISGLSAGLVACIGVLVYRRTLGLLLTAQYGALLAVYLAFQHREALAGGTSICNISALLNCDAVNTSRYAEIGGVPIALVGLAFYVAVAWLALSAFRGSAPRAAAMIMVLSVGAVGYDVFLAYASYKIPALCLICAATWGVNVLLLVGSTLESRSVSPVDALKEHAVPTLIIGLAGLIIGVLAYQTGGPTAPGATAAGSSGPATLNLASLYEQPVGTITLDGTEPMKGDPNAAYTFVEWADFQCPHCATMFPVIEQLLAENKDIKAYFRHYPISGSCNRFVDGVRHENSCQAAAAAECARIQGRFWELASQMFANPDYLGKDDLRFMAEQVGLEPKAFEACMQDPTTAQAIVADVEGGGTAQISGTPAIFLKGAFGDQWVRVIGGKEAIETILNASRSGQPLPPPPPPNPDR